MNDMHNDLSRLDRIDRVPACKRCGRPGQLLPEIALGLGFSMRDFFILIPSSPPSAARWTRQIHARKSHSFLWVLERSASRQSFEHKLARIEAYLTT